MIFMNMMSDRVKITRHYNSNTSVLLNVDSCKEHIKYLIWKISIHFFTLINILGLSNIYYEILAKKLANLSIFRDVIYNE